MKVPMRYEPYFKDILADVPGRVVMTSVGPRGVLGRVWRCLLCGQDIKPNNLGAQSHVAKHLREKSK
jgi:hypothetical protein